MRTETEKKRRKIKRLSHFSVQKYKKRDEKNEHNSRKR